jgi:hypothetical protein
LANLVLAQRSSPIGISNSPNAVLAEALNLLAQRRRYDNWAQDVQAKVATAAAELERGEGVETQNTVNSDAKPLNRIW